MTKVDPVNPFVAANEALAGKGDFDSRRIETITRIFTSILRTQTITNETTWQALTPYVFMAIELADKLADEAEKRK